MDTLRNISLIFSTVFKHYTRGPPQPSWSLKIHIMVKLYQTMISSGQQKTIEEIQKGQNFPYKVDPLVKIDKIIIPHEYRIKAQVYIEKLVEPYTIAINPVWKSPRDDGIIGEIVMNKDWNFNEEDDDWEKEKVVIFLHGGAYCLGNLNYCREMVSELSKASGARVLAIEYRLAPQQPFPAGLCDTLATYLYLTNPPDDSGFKPYKPSQIVMCGDSAGGALSISLGLALRDLGLPPPAGIVGWSPWVDLTHSFPSISDPIANESDVLPPLATGLLINLNSIAYNEFKESARNISKNIQQHPEIKIAGDDSLKRIGEPINYYIVNEGLAIPYVSPIFAESLGGLPPMLIVTGNVERFRDEDIYFSYRAANPEKYRLPAYETDFDNSRFKSPTRVTLEVYDEMFHVFQLFKFCEQSKLSIQRTGDFISKVTQEASSTDPPPHSFNALRISHNCEVQPLDESSIEHVLKWDKVGVWPGV